MNDIDRRTRESEDRLTKLELKQNLIYEKLEKIDKRTSETHDELTKYKGALGFLVFLVSSMGAAWAVFGDWIVRHMK